jgi:hypothetical protein
VLGPWVNPRRLNALAAIVVGALVALSTILTIATLLPDIDVTRLATAIFAALALVLLATATLTTRRSSQLPRRVPTDWERRTWTTPPLETLPLPAPSRSRRLALVVVRAQLLIAILLLAVRLVQLGLGT